MRGQAGSSANLIQTCCTRVLQCSELMMLSFGRVDIILKNPGIAPVFDTRFAHRMCWLRALKVEGLEQLCWLDRQDRASLIGDNHLHRSHMTYRGGDIAFDGCRVAPHYCRAFRRICPLTVCSLQASSRPDTSIWASRCSAMTSIPAEPRSWLTSKVTMLPR